MSLSKAPSVIFFYVLFLLPLLCNSTRSRSIIDLTYTLDENTPTHPKLAKFELIEFRKVQDKYGNWVEMNDIYSSEHTGTHIDAPSHFSKGGLAVNQIPPEKLYRVPGVMIDVRNRIQQNINYEIKPEDIQDWIDMYGRLPDGGVILFYTGWSRRAFSPAAYSGRDKFDKMNFPALGREAAEWIVRYGNQSFLRQGIIGVGIDTISLDVGRSASYPVHATLLGHGVYGLENVANLEKLPHRRFTLTMLPMKIGGGSGAPVRIIAELEGVSFAQALRSSSSSLLKQNTLFASMELLLFCFAASRFWDL